MTLDPETLSSRRKSLQTYLSLGSSIPSERYPSLDALIRDTVGNVLGGSRADLVAARKGSNMSVREAENNLGILLSLLREVSGWNVSYDFEKDVFLYPDSK